MCKNPARRSATLPGRPHRGISGHSKSGLGHLAALGAALLLGEWQMFVRSPLHAWIGDPELYYRSVTAHGTTMGYVFPTLVAMGFGYFVTEAALHRPLVGLRWAWAGFALIAVGGWFLVRKLQEVSRIQDCVMSGRKNCDHIEDSQER